MVGNQWHTIGYPIDGIIYATIEETLFLLEANQAVVAYKDGEYQTERYDELLLELLNFEGLSYDELREYLTLKRLGYIVWRRHVPYLQDQISEEEGPFVVFNPNSKFSKKTPTGMLGILDIVHADVRPAFDRLRDCLLLSVSDDTGQVFLEAKEVTDRLINKQS